MHEVINKSYPQWISKYDQGKLKAREVNAWAGISPYKFLIPCLSVSVKFTNKVMEKKAET